MQTLAYSIFQHIKTYRGYTFNLEKERKKTVLFPVRVDDVVMASKTGWAGNIRRQRHIGDFTQWKHQDAYKKSFDRLLHDLKTQ